MSEVKMRTPEEVGRSIEELVIAMNAISIEELDSILRSISRDSAIGPLLDPTYWRDSGMFELSHKTRKVIQAIRDFKVEVKGIGNFK